MALPSGKPKIGCQTIYGSTGDILFHGGWCSQQLFKAVTGGNDSYWDGRRVLDIGANTSGLSVEIARRGADVLAIEPDPYQNTKALAREILEEVIKSESLTLELRELGLFDAADLGRFDTVLCLGLVYHFRDQQFVIDYLSTVDCGDLVISNQTHSADILAMFNRMDPAVLDRKGFWDNYKEALSGWHPSRPMFERMLEYGGFSNVTALTDPNIDFPQKPFPLVTNSAYYRATRVKSIDPNASRLEYLPR